MTAVGAGGPGLLAQAAVAGEATTVNATNVIARGTPDVRAQSADPNAIATVTLDHSNYRSHDSTGTGIAQVNDGGANQLSTDPRFVDAAHGDYREAAGSATIDAGVDAADNGPLDFEGDARKAGAATDIGADEYEPPPPPPPPPPGGGTPVARIKAPGVARPGLPVSFSASGSAGAGLRYRWDFTGLGRFDTDGGTNPKITHVFQQPGDHHVGLRITDASGASTQTALKVHVEGASLAGLLLPTRPRAGQQIQARLHSETVGTLSSGARILFNGPPRSSITEWKFGDRRKVSDTLGEVRYQGFHPTSTAATTHTYNKAGSYDLSVELPTPVDGSSQVDARLDVRGSSKRTAWTGPTPSMEFEDYVLPGQTVHLHSGLDVLGFRGTKDLEDLSNSGVDINALIRNGGGPKGGPDHRVGQAAWDFGDGHSARGGARVNDVTHAYDHAGTFTVKLHLTDAKFGETTVTGSLHVTAPVCSLVVKGIHVSVDPAQGAGTCLSPSGPSTYLTQPGQTLTVDGVRVVPSPTLSVLIDAATGTVASSSDIYCLRIKSANRFAGCDASGSIHSDLNGFPLGTGDFTINDHAASPGVIADGLQLQSLLYGLQPTHSEVTLHPDRPATGQATLKLPPPFAATTTAAFGPGAPASAAAHDATGRRRARIEAHASSLPGFTIEVPPGTSFGPLTVNRLKLVYDPSGAYALHGGGSFSFEGATVEAPDAPPAAPDGPSGFGIKRSGGLGYAGAIYTPKKPLRIGPYVALKRVGLRYQSDPFILQGNPIDLQIPAAKDVVDIHACIAIAHPNPGESGFFCDRAHPFRATVSEYWIHLQGTATLANKLPLVNVEANLHTAGSFDFHAHSDFKLFAGVVRGSADLDGKLFTDPFAFQFEANLDHICVTQLFCAGGNLVVSSIGLAGTAYVQYVGCAGASYVYGGPLHIYVRAGVGRKLSTLQKRCDIHDEPVFLSRTASAHSPGGPAARLAAATTERLTIHPTPADATIEVSGARAAPRVIVTGPRGERYIDDGRRQQRLAGAAIFNSLTPTQTSVAIARPEAGQWTVSVAPGSPPIDALAVDYGVNAPRLQARVTGRGFRRVLAYTARLSAGQTVTFAEQGHDAGRVLGTAHAGRGEIRFAPADGSAGRRKIVAMVRQDGAPLENLTLATYSAPRPAVPARVAGLRARARGTALAVTWGQSAHASVYHVTLILGDGRRIDRQVSGRNRRVALGGYGSTDTLTARVVAIATDGRQSRPTTIKLRPRQHPRVRRLVV